MRAPDFGRRQQGLTLLELAMVLALMGTYLMVILHYRAGRISDGDTVESGFQDQIVAATYRYAERHFRLPCADTDGDGLEGSGASGCGGDSQYQTGGVPFRTLGMSESDILGTAVTSPYIYGVYRNAGQGADLAVLEERTGDQPNDTGYRQIDDLRYALHGLTAKTVDTSRAYVTGDGEATGSANCANNHVTNVAFFVVYAGTRDADGDGKQLDGANASLSSQGSSSVCASGQTTRTSEQYDDSVVAVGFSELLGYLTH